jgi:hypothetical protein
MALTKGTNSYVTAAEADAYFADRLNVAAWNNASASEKEQALITATALIDNKNWIGVAVSDTQALAFPRIGAYFDPKVGADVILQDDTVPLRIEIGTMELAYHLLNNSDLLDDTGTVDIITVGSITLEDIDKPQQMPSFVLQYIQPLFDRTYSTNAWWRAN